mgnify:FL=1
MSKLKNISLRGKWMLHLYTFLVMFFSVFVAEAIAPHQAIAGFHSDNYNDDEITQTELVEVVELHDGERLHQVIKHYRNNQRVKCDKPNRRINSTTFSTADVVTHIKSKLGNITTTYVRELTKKFTPSIPLLAVNPTPTATPFPSPNPTPSSVTTPTLGVMVNHNWIDGWDFQPQATVTVSVNGGDKGTKQATADQDGYCWLENWSGGVDGNRISVGDTVKATYDGGSVEMVVQDVEASVDLENDRITGTALNPEGSPLVGRKIRVSVYEKWSENEPELTNGETTVSSDGSFTITLSSFDLVRGQKVFLTLWNAADGSESGNRTMIAPYNAIPTLGVMVNHNWIDGWDFQPQATVTVSVNGGDKGTKQATADQDGYCWLENWSGGVDGNRISVGDTVKATYDGGSVEMVVQDVEASVDLENDRITGTALNPEGSPLVGRKIRVSVYEKWSENEPELTNGETTVSSDGSFTITLSSFDLVRGQKVFLTLWDASDGSESGNCTYVEPYNAIPTLGAGISWGGWVDGWDFLPQATVTVSVNSGNKGTKQATTDQDGYFLLEDWSGGDDGKRISVGDTVKATYDGGSVEMVVQDVEASVDLENNQIKGTALSPEGASLKGRKVKAYVYSENWEKELTTGETTVESDGSFTIKLSSFDLVKGQGITVIVWEASDGSESGNCTYIDPYNAIPALGAAVNYKWVDGWDFLPQATVTVSINGGNKGTKQITADQDGDFVLEDYGVYSGDTITARYDGGTVEMTVQDVAASVDLEENRVTGTAFTPAGKPLKGRKIEVIVVENLEEDTPELATSETTVSPEGSFTITFSSFDVINEQNIVIILWDDEDGSEKGNRTYFVIAASTSAVCEGEKIGVSKSSHKLRRNESSKIIVKITGKNDCLVEGEMIKVTVNSSGKKYVSVIPASATTNTDGEATFMIIAKDKSGRGIIKFLAGDLKKLITVKVGK